MTSQADSSSPTTPEGMSDFTVLHRDFERFDEDDDVGPDGAAVARLAKKRGEAIARVCRILTDDRSRSRRPLRIVFLGKHGSGKSSFINSVGAAFSEEAWHEHAYTGYHGGSATPITIFTQRFEKCCNGTLERYQNVPLPTLIDVAGKMDIGDDKMEELLRLIFYGHIEEDSAIMKAYEFCERHTRDEIRAEYGTAYPEMKVDRVVFVASADDKIPEKLIGCVVRAARPLHFTDVKRSIPVFGVLTKKDKVSDPNSSEFKERKETFMRALGLHANRFLCCSNYCDDIDPEGKRTKRLNPSIDVPIVEFFEQRVFVVAEFFEQVCDSAQKVIQDKEELPGAKGQKAEKTRGRPGAVPEGQGELVTQIQTVWRDLGPMVQALVASVFVGVVVWMALYLLLVLPASGGFESTVREQCDKGNIKDRVILDACRAPPPTSPVWGTTFIAFSAAVGCLIYMILGRRP
ncbi:hypothetical protein BaRGS_00006209 [Batillaria attramentaria]|uniref:G domain-containing protein n=1 Tax=Batillaria attramentaria TaxID=370345 RepID=A0ABD0LSV6_9CAEN